LNLQLRTLVLAAVLSFFAGYPEVHANGEFKARDLDGGQTVLSAHFEPGKWTLVMLWTTYCGACQQQFPLLNAFQDAHRLADAKVVGIALDGYHQIDEIRAHIAKNRISFPNLAGELSQISPSIKEATGEPLDGTPTYLLFSTIGDIAAFKVGPIQAGEIERFMKENPS